MYVEKGKAGMLGERKAMTTRSASSRVRREGGAGGKVKG